MGQCFPGGKLILSRRYSSVTDGGGVEFSRQQQLIEMFSHEQVEVLRRRFEAASSSTRLTPEDFAKLLPGRLFPRFDLDRTGGVAFRDFCVGLAVGTFGAEADLSQFLLRSSAVSDRLLLSAFPPLEDEQRLASLVHSFHENSGITSPCASPVRALSDEPVAIFPQSWVVAWLGFVGNRSPRPGLIDCDSLLDISDLKSNLLQDYDFVLFPVSVARPLLRIYGVVNASPPLRRLNELRPAFVHVRILPGAFCVSGLVSLRDSLLSLAICLAQTHLTDCGWSIGLAGSDTPLLALTSKGVVGSDVELRQLVASNGSNCLYLIMKGEEHDTLSGVPVSCLWTPVGNMVPAVRSTTAHLHGMEGAPMVPDRMVVDRDVVVREVEELWLDIDGDSPEEASWARTWLAEEAWQNSLDRWIGISGGMLEPTANHGHFGFQSSSDESDLTGEVDEAGSRKLAGLKNLGNTCFINAVLQCLRHTEFFRNFFLSSRFQRQVSRSPNGVAAQFEILFRDLEISAEPVDPRKFKKTSDDLAPEFSDRMQHDAHEYFSALLELLHLDLRRMSTNDATSSNNPSSSQLSSSQLSSSPSELTMIEEIFEGVLSVTLECVRCGDERNVSKELFRALPVSLTAQVQRVVHVTHFLGGGMRRVRVKNVRSVTDLFDKMLSSEPGTGEWCLVENVERSGRAGRILTMSEGDESIRQMKDETELVLCSLAVQAEVFSLWRRRSSVTSTAEGRGVVVVVQQRRGGVVFGVPFVMRTSEDGDCRELYRRLEEGCMRNFGTREWKKVVVTDARGRRCGRTRCEMREACTGCELPRVRRVGDLSALQAGKIYIGIEWEMKQVDKLVMPLLEKRSEISEIAERSISACVASALETEEVDDVECEKCGDRGKFVKKTELDKYPEILVVVVKRFSFCVFGYAGKLQDPVKVEETLEISGNLYELYAVLSHEGSLSGSGHYTALVKETEGNWLRCDDTKVATVGPDIPDYCRKSCYMLFYRKKKPRVATLLTYSSSFSRSSSKPCLVVSAV